jgi:hypothetical protein
MTSFVGAISLKKTGSILQVFDRKNYSIVYTDLTIKNAVLYL